MGNRALKRVPLNFNAPLHKLWEGYINPHYKKCPQCGTKGITTDRQYLDRVARLILIAGQSSLNGKIHPCIEDFIRPSRPPSPDMAEISTGLAGRKPNEIFGYDALDRYRATEKIITAAGLDPETWGKCPICHGDGCDPAVKTEYENWKPTEPPQGDGYQLWETCTEGSPISPVFATAEELADWCAENATIWGDEKTSRENWLKMFKEDSLDFNSLFVIKNGYMGSVVNKP